MPEKVSLDESYAVLLKNVGIADAVKSLGLLQSLAGQGVTDDDISPLLPLLFAALSKSPDPDRALGSFARWFAAVGNPYSHLQSLVHHPIALDVFCLVTGSSQYFADLLARQPEYFEIIANPGVRGGTKSAAQLFAELSALVDVCQRQELKRDALRRWKAREMLRIGVRDLTGLADMPATAREFSNLADACVQKAHDIALAAHPALPQPQFAVIAMGKLGGQELNYSSDIDLMFVHGDDPAEETITASGRRIETSVHLTRLAETLIKVLNEDSTNGHVFRVDMRLRPEGRFGALTRSLSGFRAYYESWAEAWERQALIKARFIAGDRALGQAFLTLAHNYVYRSYVSLAFLAEIRENKRRIEQKCALEGETFTNVKTGYGGIRDIEFIVQLLQLEFGGAHPTLQNRNTLRELERLRQAQIITAEDADSLSREYQFLRTLEHRLQLLHGFQTQTLPLEGTEERVRVARRMGYSNTADFEQDLAARRDRVHRLLETLFYELRVPSPAPAAPEASDKDTALLNLLDQIATPSAQQKLSILLSEAGFRDLPAALRSLALPMRGNEFGTMPPDTPAEFKRIAPRLLELLANCADPDAALSGIEALATAVPNRAQLYAAFDDSPEVLPRLVRLAAASPPLFRLLTRHIEWLEGILSPDDAEAEIEEGTDLKTVYVEAMRQRISAANGYDVRLETLAHYLQRERLLIAARDIWNETDVTGTMASLTALADATLEILLIVCTDALLETHSDRVTVRTASQSLAVIGLGKLGGGELGYGSDWDLMFVYDDGQGSTGLAEGNDVFTIVNALVERIAAAGKTLAGRGAGSAIDLRLRPWGKEGAVVHSLRGFIAYYKSSGETWERHAAMKARFAAGNRTTGERFVRILHAVSFGRGLTADEDQAVRDMKRRIETERLDPLERNTNLKLGYGGLTDIEWLCQRLQLLNGTRRISLRVANTLQAISALATLRLLDNSEADALTDAYRRLTAIRNVIWMRTGSSIDVLPDNPFERRTLARLIGYTNSGELSAETRLRADLQTQMQEARRIFSRRFNNELRLN